MGVRHRNSAAADNQFLVEITGAGASGESNQRPGRHPSRKQQGVLGNRHRVHVRTAEGTKPGCQAARGT